MSTSPLLYSPLLAILQQQLINQLAEGGSGSLADALLQRRQKTGREIAAEAVTGRIRSDAGMLRQASRNVGEGGAIAAVAKEGVSSMLASLKQMKQLADSLSPDSPADAVAAASDAYAGLASGVKSTIRKTNYNGISLMDKTAWADDDRVTVHDSGPSPVTGTIAIWAGGANRDLTLADFSEIAAEPASALNATLDASNADALSGSLSELIKTTEMHEKSYASLASSMSAEAKSIDRQASILDTTAARSIAGAGKDSASLLLSLLLGNQGKLINKQS